MQRITCLVLHCSDSPDNVDIGAKEIRAWHTEKPPKGRGWRDIGYHYVIRKSGRIELGRAENGDPFISPLEVGAHVQGHNSHTLGICWVGRNDCSGPQRSALLSLLVSLLMRLNLKPDAVKGHRELAPESGKTCPNIDMEQLRSELQAIFKGGAA